MYKMLKLQKLRGDLIALAASAILAIGLITTALLHTPTAPVQQSTPAAVVSTGIEASQLLSGVNEQRAQSSLAPLISNALLDQSAQLKLDDIITRNYWSHNAPNGVEPWVFFDKVGYDYSHAGENLAYGYNNANDVIQAWVSSPTHKANMLGDYRELGLAIKKASSFRGQGNVYVIVAHFGKPR